MSIRRVVYADIPEIMVMEKQFGNDAFSKSYLCSNLDNPYFFCMEVDGVLVGYYLLLRHIGKIEACLDSICIKKELHGLGYGSKMLRHMEDFCMHHKMFSILLEVSENNPRAQKLYETLGYEKYGIVNNFYHDGSAAIKMRKNLIK